MTDQRSAFGSFVTDVEPRLRRALCSVRGPEAGRDATAEALAWAWEHWDRAEALTNPVAYLYRVGISRTRLRRADRDTVGGDRWLATVPAHGVESGFEPGLGPALRSLTDRQRQAVVLIHGCGWTHQEVADALDITRTAVGTHLERGMRRLRDHLGASDG